MDKGRGCRRGWATGWEWRTGGDVWGSGQRWGIDKVCVGFYRHESGVKFRVKGGTEVVPDESAESCIRSIGATATKAVAEKTGPAYSLTCPHEPFVGGAPAQFWRSLNGAFESGRWIWIVEVVE